MFAVLVHIEVYPDHLEAFRAAMMENARASLRDEVGCHRFDVAFDAKRPEAIMLYELYSDAAAFETHMSMPHYAQFQELAGPMVRHKSVETWDEVHS